MMKKCLACENEQETGKFCGKCGTKFVEVAELPSNESSDMEEAAATIETLNLQETLHVPPVVNTQPNEHVEKVKVHSKQFWSYFVNYIKKPSEIFATGDREFVNAFISVLLYALVLSVTVYVSISSFAKNTIGGLGGFGELFMEEYKGPPFFTIVSSVFIFTLASMALAVLAILIICKLFGPSYSWKEILSYYGTHILSGTTLALVGFLLILVKSYLFGNVVLVLSFSLILSIIPAFIINKLLITKSKNADPFYGYLLYILLFAVIYWIFIMIIADSTIGQVINQFPRF